MGRIYLIFILFLVGCYQGKQTSDNYEYVDSTSIQSLDTMDIPDFGVDEIRVGDGSGGHISTRTIQKVVVNTRNSSTKINQSNFGQIVYTIPDTMRVFSDHKVIVRISKEEGLVNIEENLNGKIVKSTLRVESRMEVKIIDPTGENFKIVPINRERQLIEMGEYTQWTFNVIPLRSGRDLKLDLVVSIIIGDDSKELVYSDSVIVKSSPTKQIKSWWESNWHWILEVMLIPVGVWIWNYLRNKLKKNSSR